MDVPARCRLGDTAAMDENRVFVHREEAAAGCPVFFID